MESSGRAKLAYIQTIRSRFTDRASAIGAASGGGSAAVDGAAAETAPEPLGVPGERGTILFPSRVAIDVDSNQRAVLDGGSRNLLLGRAKFPSKTG